MIYEIYPRSFADADGDGEGDLAGITSRLPYLAELGVDAIWIAPWYPSPMADGGCDVSDYCDIDPRFGTLADADLLIATAHRLGLRVLIDLVANHTSCEHRWFREAVRGGRGSPERDRYLFRDGHGPGGELPPNNWISAFGQGAWTRVVEPDGSLGQWYCHTFAPEQPDLNWENEQVREDFDDILRFWLDRGVDGFRIDAVSAMAKKPGLPDADYGGDLRFASREWIENPHWDVDGVHDVLRRWRSLIDSCPGDQIFVAEAVVRGPERLARYLRPDELHTAFNFDYVHARWEPDHLRGVIDSTLTALAPIGAPPTWALSSHDETRHLARFGRAVVGWTPMGHEAFGVATDRALGERRARAAILLTLALPGGAYLYQGEELGLPEVEDLPVSVLQDPVFHRSGGTVRGRDGCRVPLPWSGDASPYGFSDVGVEPWLPQPSDWGELTAEAQSDRPDSMLALYRTALVVRRSLGLRVDEFSWLESPPEVIAFGRGEAFVCLLNLGLDPVPLPADGRVLVSSVDLAGDGLLPPDSAAWVARPERGPGGEAEVTSRAT